MCVIFFVKLSKYPPFMPGRDQRAPDEAIGFDPPVQIHCGVSYRTERRLIWSVRY